MENLTKSDSDHADFPPAQLNTSPDAIGVRLLRDTRPNRVYPTAGTLLDLSVNFFSANQTLGTTTSEVTPNPAGQGIHLQTYRIIFNAYSSLRKKQVLAYNLYLCGTGGDAPFYGQCIFGVQNELQGHTAGRYNRPLHVRDSTRVSAGLAQEVRPGGASAAWAFGFGEASRLTHQAGRLGYSVGVLNRGARTPQT